jgi:hypothetical protein
MTEQPRIRYCRNCDRDLSGRGGLVEYVVQEDVRCDCMNHELDPRTGFNPGGHRPCLGANCNKGTDGERWGCEECNFTMWVYPCGSCSGHGVYDLMGQTLCVGDERGRHDNRGALL